MTLETRYKILEKIGSGSFATVYRARDAELGREVAIKQLHSEFLSDPQRLDRFWQESQLLASLQHPNIVTIFDIVRERGWLVLELMQGSLAERLSGRQIDLRALRATLAHVLRALKYLHSQGIIHGDIKPGNLMIDARRRVKLADFGLACRVATADGSLLKGTTKYMAPETVSDDFGEVGPASDLYSLGFSAYDLMCGPNFEELFPGLNAKGRNQQVAWMMWHAAHDRRLPEISRVLEGVPPDLAKVVQRLTQKDQSLRYRTADEALSDLQVDLKLVGSVSSQEVNDYQPADPGKRRTYLAAGALGLSVMMSLGMLFWEQDKSTPQKSDRITGFVRDVLADKHEFVTQHPQTGALDIYHIPEKGGQRIYLQNERKNILLRDLRPGDHVEMVVDKEKSDLVINMTVDRPVITHGVLRELELPDSRLILSMEEGNTRDDLPVHVPETALLTLNNQSVKLTELQVGDQLEVSHLSGPDAKKGRIVYSLKARRILTTVGNVAQADVDHQMLTVQIGQGAVSGSLKLPVVKNCKLTLNDAAAIDGKALTIGDLKPGDRVSVRHDTEIFEIAASRSEQFDAVIVNLDPESSKLVASLPTGERHELVVDPKCEVTLSLDRVTLADLRPYDAARISYSETANQELVATTVDARRPPQNDRWTLVIGTQGYADLSLSPLKSIVSDARLVQSAFLTRYAVSPIRGALMIDGTKKDWTRQVAETLKSATANTQVILFIAGHAYRADDGTVFLAPKDFRYSEMATTGVSLNWMAEKFNESPSADKILILDVTHEMTGKDLKSQIAGKAIVEGLTIPFKNTYVILSCDRDQQSRPLADADQSFFATILAQAIRGAADANRDLHLTPQELFDYLTKQAATSKERVFKDQTPVMIEPMP